MSRTLLGSAVSAIAFDLRPGPRSDKPPVGGRESGGRNPLRDLGAPTSGSYFVDTNAYSCDASATCDDACGCDEGCECNTLGYFSCASARPRTISLS